MKKYVRSITSRFRTLCRKCNSNLVFIQAALQKLPKWNKHYNLLNWWGSYEQKESFQIFCKTAALKNFAKIHRKTSVLKSPFNKIKAWNFIKYRLQHTCFPVNFAKFLRKHFLKNTPTRLLLCGTYF